MGLLPLYETQQLRTVIYDITVCLLTLFTYCKVSREGGTKVIILFRPLVMVRVTIETDPVCTTTSSELSSTTWRFSPEAEIDAFVERLKINKVRNLQGFNNDFH